MGTHFTWKKHLEEQRAGFQRGHYFSAGCKLYTGSQSPSPPDHPLATELEAPLSALLSRCPGGHWPEEQCLWTFPAYRPQPTVQKQYGFFVISSGFPGSPGISPHGWSSPLCYKDKITFLEIRISENRSSAKYFDLSLSRMQNAFYVDFAVNIASFFEGILLLQGPGSKRFRLCGPRGACHRISAVQLESESIHR